MPLMKKLIFSGLIAVLAVIVPLISHADIQQLDSSNISTATTTDTIQYLGTGLSGNIGSIEVKWFSAPGVDTRLLICEYTSSTLAKTPGTCNHFGYGDTGNAYEIFLDNTAGSHDGVVSLVQPVTGISGQVVKEIGSNPTFCTSGSPCSGMLLNSTRYYTLSISSNPNSPTLHQTYGSTNSYAYLTPTENFYNDSTVKDMFFNISGSTNGGTGSGINITFPSTPTSTTARFNAFTYDYSLDHVQYPYYIVGVAQGTDPSALPIAIGTGNLITASVDSGSGSVQSANDIQNYYQEGQTYYAKLVLWGTTTSTLAGFPPLSSKLAISNMVEFTISSGSIIEVIPPTVAGGTLFSAGDCSAFPATQTYLGIPFIAPTIFDKGVCVVNNFVDKTILTVDNYASSSYGYVANGIQHTFPINVISTFKDDINTGTVASTTPDIVLGNGSSTVFGGRIYTILSTSTTAWIKDSAGFDYKDFISKIIYFVTGGIMLLQVIVLIAHMHRQQQT